MIYNTDKPSLEQIREHLRQSKLMLMDLPQTAEVAKMICELFLFELKTLDPMITKAKTPTEDMQ